MISPSLADNSLIKDEPFFFGKDNNVSNVVKALNINTKKKCVFCSKLQDGNDEKNLLLTRFKHNAAVRLGSYSGFFAFPFPSYRIFDFQGGFFFESYV